MTIYALSSGPGISGVAVVRVSGKDTAEVVKKTDKRRIAISKSSNPKKVQ